MSQATISARIDNKDKAAFDAFCDQVGLTASSAINMFVKKVILEKKIPFEISVPQTVSLEEGRNAFYQLRKEAEENGSQDMSLDEINAEISAARAAR